MESLRGNNKILLKNNKLDIKFQVVDWTTSNKDKVILDENGEVDESSKFKDNKEYIIRAYGVTEKGTSISLNIYNFPPHFYINVPEGWNKQHLNKFVKFIKDKLGNYYKDSLIQADFKIRKKFWGFTNNKKFKFVRLMFKNTRALDKVVKIFQKKVKILGLHNQERKYELFESNIQPFIRFMHINDLKSASWIEIKSGCYSINYENESNCQIDIDADWNNVKSYDSNEMAPFITASFDIEADSSHGDFPLAKKDYKKLANDILEKHEKNLNILKKNKSLNNKNNELVSKIKHNLENRVEYLNHLLKLAFNPDNKKLAIENPDDYDIDINYVFTKLKKKPNLTSINKVAEATHKLLDYKESYLALAQDIISKYRIEVLDMDELTYLGIENHESFQSLLDDSFIEESKKEFIDDITIHKTYTKNNIKPTEACMIHVSKKTSVIYKKLVQQIMALDTMSFKKVSYILKNYEDLDNDEIKNKLELDTDDINMIKNFVDLAINRLLSLFESKFPDIDSSRDVKIVRIKEVMNQYFPAIEGDKVIQIGTTVQKFGEKDCFMKHIITLKGCEPIDGCVVESYNDEAEVLLAWTRFIQKLDPDIITGYNIFGFDFVYMYHRAEELLCEEDFAKLGRVYDKFEELQYKSLSSSALGDNTLKFIPTEGRVQMDLLKVIQRDHNLVSYKLDYVAETFINDDVVKFDKNHIELKGGINLNDGNFITFNVDGEEFEKGRKFKINKIDDGNIKLDINIGDKFKNSKKIKWQLAKDDVKPQDIFRLQKGNDNDRKIVAVYCIQDCKLCLDLINKLDLLTNNIGMANVCSVPLSYIFLRGQGVKIFSLVSKQCRKDNFLIPVIKCQKEEIVYQGKKNLKYDYAIEDSIGSNDDGYEGAIVLKPNPGIYLKEPVAVLDYASLYPSSMISENLSHDTICIDDEYLGDEGIKRLEELGYGYEDITFDLFSWIDPKVKNKGKHKTGTKTCRFVQFPDEEKGVIPRILQYLLKARKDTRKKIKTETDVFKKSVLDGLQLAYKITANSLYGQIGAKTSPISFKDIAASTTATGRKLLHLAKDKVQIHMPGTDIVYGDTDSIFVNFNPKDENGNRLYGRDALKRTIELGEQFENEFCQYLKKPHHLEYEKTFWPFILLSKKRYVGNKYEFDLDKYKRTSMGIVLKRRDNAEIVKHVYGGIIDIFMNHNNKNPVEQSIEFLHKSLNDLIDGKFGLEMLTITKSLRGYYKNPESVAHKVLADRMGERDPGNKPASNDRIPFAYIQVKEKKGTKILQGDRVEHPDFIKDNNLKPDYNFYISNQIKNPVAQIYGLIVEQLSGFNKNCNYYNSKFATYKRLYGETKANNKITDLKIEDASKILFNEILRKTQNKKDNVREITDFFKIKK